MPEILAPGKVFVESLIINFADSLYGLYIILIIVKEGDRNLIYPRNNCLKLSQPPGTFPFGHKANACMHAVSSPVKFLSDKVFNVTFNS